MVKMEAAVRPRVVVLAAGQGSRLGDLAAGRPKSLMPIGGEPLLVRTLGQLWRRGFGDLTVVVGHAREQVTAAVTGAGLHARFIENPRYATDTNIRSLVLGLDGRDAPALVVEADVALDDPSADALTQVAMGRSSTWITNGPFRPSQVGGILRAKVGGRVEDLQLVPGFDAQYANYSKLLGLLYIGPGQMALYHQLLREAAERSTAQYYLAPWIENLRRLASRARDFGGYRAGTFNTADEYQRCRAFIEQAPIAPPVELVDVPRLRHIEGWNFRRVDWLARKIEREGVWRVPLAVERQHHLVMDGQHRMEVARRMGLAVVPAVLYTYGDVELWSLRARHPVTAESIIRRALAGDPYPYKTAKHMFPTPLPSISIPLAELRAKTSAAEGSTVAACA